MNGLQLFGEHDDCFAVFLKNSSAITNFVAGQTAALERPSVQDGCDPDKSLAELAQSMTAAQALEDSEERFRSLFNEAPIAYHEIDSTGVVVSVNRNECDLLGYEPSAIVGRYIWDFVAAEERAASQKAVAEKLSKQRQLEVFTRSYVNRDGTRLTLEVHENLIHGRQGNVIGIRSAMLDVTARVTAEEALQRKAKELDRSNSELQQFAFVASHDLQEPLRKIQAFGDLLRNRCGELLNGQGLDYLDRMQNAAGRMQRLINDLLSLSRAGTRAQNFVTIDLNAIVRGVLSDLEIRIQQEGAVVTCGPLPTVQADPIQITQLIQNLVANGLKFHAPGEAPRLEIESHVVDADNYQIIVTDHGIGFDQKYTDRIFQVFQRLHGRLEFEGTGIGLSVCRRIAERHGGTITAKSAPGQGAKFTVELPLQPIMENQE